jgi:hypothetical protein
VARIITAGGLGSRLPVNPDADTAISAAAADMSAWRSNNSIAPTYAS